MKYILTESYHPSLTPKNLATHSQKQGTSPGKLLLSRSYNLLGAPCRLCFIACNLQCLNKMGSRLSTSLPDVLLPSFKSR